VFGIDISESMIARAEQLNEHGDRVRYVTGDLGALSGQKFDFIFSIYVIQHIPRSMQRDVLRSLVGLLHPDGLLAIQISAPSSGLKRIRAHLAPRWLKERSFKRRFKGAPLIEMNPLSHDEVARAIAPATIRLVHGEWYFVQPA